MSDIISKTINATPRLLDLRAKSRENAMRLSKIECTEPMFGNWLETHSIPVLKEVLSMSDEEMTEVMGRPAGDGYSRERMLAAINTHILECPRCSLQAQLDSELEESMITKTAVAGM